MNRISLILPVHNEAQIITAQVRKIIAFLEKAPGLDAFEILLCGNGCTDKTHAKALKLASRDQRVRAFDNPRRGIGVGLKDGIRAMRRYEFGMFYAIDLPFGLEVITDSMKAIQDHDLVVGSKAHPKSRVRRSVGRRVLTLFYGLILKGFFDLDVRDPQGSLFWRNQAINRILPALTADSAFLETQIAIYFQAMHFRIMETPVTLRTEMRKTRIAFINEAGRIIPEILRERKNYMQKRASFI